MNHLLRQVLGGIWGRMLHQTKELREEVREDVKKNVLGVSGYKERTPGYTNQLGVSSENQF